MAPSLLAAKPNPDATVMARPAPRRESGLETDLLGRIGRSIDRVAEMAATSAASESASDEGSKLSVIHAGQDAVTTRLRLSGTTHVVRLSDDAGPSGADVNEAEGGDDVEDSSPASVEGNGRSLTASSRDKAASLLQRLLVSPDVTGDEWMQVSRALRETSVEHRRFAPRVASVALLLSDALAFTPPEQVEGERRRPLASGLQLLLEPFVPQDREEHLFRSLVTSGWRVTAYFDDADFTPLIEPA
jgi:hypothetical protein